MAGKDLVLKTRSMVCLLVPVAAALIVSCSEPGSEAPSDRNVHPPFWMSPLAEYSHGSAAFRDGTGSCEICHGLDLNGAGLIPGCRGCHFDALGSRAPVGSSWVHGSAQHGRFTDQNEVCNRCHAILRDYGLPPASCHDCHSEGTAHPTGQAWLDKKSSIFHGIDAAQDLAQCAACHGGDYRGGTSGVSCFRCHFTAMGGRVPDGHSWSHGTTPHEALTSFDSVCNQCHDVNRTYGNAPSSCHDCHGIETGHATGSGWLLPGNHAQASIADRASCLNCHDLSPGGGGTSPACRSCHTRGDPPMAIGSCSSCHGNPPGTGEHREHRDTGCNTCHDGFGTGSLNHYYPSPSPPADVRFRFSVSGDDLSYDGSRCSGTCHMGDDDREHESERW